MFLDAFASLSVTWQSQIKSRLSCNISVGVRNLSSERISSCITQNTQENLGILCYVSWISIWKEQKKKTAIGICFEISHLMAFVKTSVRLHVMACERVVNTAKLVMIKLIRTLMRCSLQAGLNSCVKACQVRF